MADMLERVKLHAKWRPPHYRNVGSTPGKNVWWLNISGALA